jgi:hypothetical protein
MYCASGGLIGSAEQWDIFLALWSHETQTLKEPFRSTDCESQLGQFKDWTILKCNDLMARLITVIQKARLSGFASIVPVDAYKEAFPSCREQDAYLLTIPHTIMNMAYTADLIGRDVNLWFENGPFTSTISGLFTLIKKVDWKPIRRIGAIAFDSKHLRPLQSADLVARESFKHMVNLGVRPTRIPVRRLQNKLCFLVWTRETLQYLARNGGPGNLDLLATWDAQSDAPKLRRFWRNF